MGVRRLFWCSLLAGAVFVAGCGSQSNGGDSDSSANVNRLDRHVQSHCSGNNQTEQGFLYSHEQLDLGGGLRMRVFGKLSRPVRVRWQLCEMPPTQIEHGTLGIGKTIGPALTYVVEDISSGVRIAMSEVLQPGGRLEVYSEENSETVFLLVKKNDFNPRVLISIKDLGSKTVKSVLSISKTDVIANSEAAIEKEEIEQPFREVNKQKWSEIGGILEKTAFDATKGTAEVLDETIQAGTKVAKKIVVNVGEIAGDFVDLGGSVVGLVFDSLDLGVSKLGNLLPGHKKSGSSRGGKTAKQGPSVLDQVCDAINPVLVNMQKKFCKLRDEEINSNAYQYCSNFIDKVEEKVKNENSVDVSIPKHLCVIYGHGAVQYCGVKNGSSTKSGSDDKEKDALQDVTKSFLESCKTP